MTLFFGYNGKSALFLGDSINNLSRHKPLKMLTICDALRDLIPFVQFKKREKHPLRSDTFNKVAGFSLKFSVIEF